jgi:hypothetical protein
MILGEHLSSICSTQVHNGEESTTAIAFVKLIPSDITPVRHSTMSVPKISSQMNHGYPQPNSSLNVPPPLWQVVGRFVRLHLLVESLDIPLTDKATNDTHNTACNDQNATVLIARFLGAKLDWSTWVWDANTGRLTKKYGVNQCETDAMQLVIATNAPRFVRGRATLVVSQGMWTGRSTTKSSWLVPAIA